MAIYILGVSFLFGLICMPLFIACCIMSLKRWKLYITHKGIFYARPIYCSFNHWFIPLEDIEDILIAPGTTHTIWVKIDPRKISEYILLYNRQQPNCLVLEHVQNSDDFVAAVKREKEGN